MKQTLFAIAMLMLIASRPAWSQQEHAAAAASEPAHAEADAQPHPVISEDGSWAGSMVIIVLGLFLAAAVIGPIVRANMPAELPPAHSHDEPPGTSGHHGKSGTIDHEAPEYPGGHGHGH